MLTDEERGVQDRAITYAKKNRTTICRKLTDKELYSNLNSASRELDLLLQDFRLNPKRYVNVSVFGKKQSEYSVPEEDPADTIEN